MTALALPSQPILPPGPSSRVPSKVFLDFQRDRPGFLLDAARRYGDVVHFNLFGNPVYLLSHPEDIREVLEQRHEGFVKGRGLARARVLLGEGLLTAEGAAHGRHRRLVMPAFHRARMVEYGRTMVAAALGAQARWREGEQRDMATEMMRLTRTIVARTLFGADLSARDAELDAALATVVRGFGSVNLFLPEWLLRHGLLPEARRARAAMAYLDDTVYRLIRERRAEGGDHGDLLSMLLAAVDAEGDGGGFSDQQLRDEVMTLFLAGHETTANALAWTWYLLSEHPEEERRLHEELDRVLEGRAPSAEDLPELGFARRVLSESMRLYPPAWVIGRRATRDHVIHGFGIPENAGVLLSQWVVHHDPRWYPDPFRFDPDRWLPGGAERRPKYAYFPFGGGPRRCIGEAFAWQEGLLILATLAQHWRFRLVPGHPVEPDPMITLRPRHGLRMTFAPRPAR